jgi:hypothetical protein
MNDWCSYCGEARAAKGDLCGECDDNARRSDAMEASGRSLEPSVRSWGGGMGLARETTDYSRPEEI